MFYIYPLMSFIVQIFAVTYLSLSVVLSTRAAGEQGSSGIRGTDQKHLGVHQLENPSLLVQDPEGKA